MQDLTRNHKQGKERCQAAFPARGGDLIHLVSLIHLVCLARQIESAGIRELDHAPSSHVA